MNNSITRKISRPDFISISSSIAHRLVILGDKELKGPLESALIVIFPGLYLMVSQINGEIIGRGSKRSGWLHTLRSCISTFIIPIKPPVSIARVDDLDINSSYKCNCLFESLQ